MTYLTKNLAFFGGLDGMQAPCAEKMCAEKARPLRRSRARFPLLSPAVTSSPGAGEVFPQRGSQAVTSVAKALGEMRKCPVVLLALPLGEVASRSDDGEGARHYVHSFSLARRRGQAGRFSSSELATTGAGLRTPE